MTAFVELTMVFILFSMALALLCLTVIYVLKELHN